MNKGLHPLSHMYVHPTRLPHLVYTAEISPNLQPTQQLCLALNTSAMLLMEQAISCLRPPYIDESKQERVPC